MKNQMYKFRAVLIITLANLFISSSIFAQSPQKMSYQVVIRNSSNALVQNTKVGMQISILQGTAEGVPVYTETQAPTTNANGLASIELGTGIPTHDFSLIDWADGPYFIKTETDPAGGTNYTITGTSQLLSVPYALHAKTAEKISNLTNPVNAQDPATKAYVDMIKTNIRNFQDHVGFFGSIDPHDGTIYEAVKIGDQFWMTENLKVTHYANGEEIPFVSDDSDWVRQIKTGAYCFNNNDENNESDTYGALYNYTAALNVCPDGWHLPTKADWDLLDTFLGPDGGSKLADNAPLWHSGDLVDDIQFGETGFSALPGGVRYGDDGSFHDFIGASGYWWCATEYPGNTFAYARQITYENTSFTETWTDKLDGMSVRCVRD